MLSVIFISVCLLLLYLCYEYILFPAFFSPLSKIPSAHFTASFSPLWMLWIRYKHRETRTVFRVHQQLGPIVRLGPNEISVACVDGGIRTIYGNFERHGWYRNAFENFGTLNMVSFLAGKEHSERKRMLSNVYSKSFIQNNPDVSKISGVLLYEKLLPSLDTSAKAGSLVEVLELSTAAFMDFTSSYIFGLKGSTNFLGDKEYRKYWLNTYCSQKPYSFWLTELPQFSRFLRNLGIQVVPPAVDEASANIEKWCLDLCVAAAGPSHFHDEDDTEAIIYNQFVQKLEKSGVPVQARTKVIASELMDQLIAGAETSAVTVTYAMYELSSRPALQAALRKELSSLTPPLDRTTQNQKLIPSPRALEELPLLDAILQETLRLYDVNPAPQPRITPPTSTTLGSYTNIPGGVRVSASAYTLHRNPDVFPEPFTWNPYRWLETQGEARKEMNRWFWAFSSGGRMCIGLHLALHEMKLLLAGIYTNFSTTIAEAGDMEQADTFIARPKGDKLMLKFDQPTN